VNLQARDKKALAILAAAFVVVLILRAVLSNETPTAVVPPTESIALVERRLAALRRQAALLPASEKVLSAVSAEAAAREKGVIQAETAAQAQAQLLQILRRVASGQPQPIELKTAEIGNLQPLGDQYAEVFLPVAFQCRIEQLLNLLADLTAQPEALATREIRISAAEPKQKLLGVRLVVSAIAPRKLLPRKTEAPSL
jgi:hypothetical protein